MNPILLRITEFAESKKLSQRQFSLSLGRSASYLSNTLKQGSAPSVDLVSIISVKYPELNLRWLITGDGDMTINPGDNPKKFRESKIEAAIDEKIEARLGGLEEIVRQLLADMISDELANARNALEKSKNGS